MLKEKYLEVKNWLETANEKIVNFIKNERLAYYSDKNDCDKFITTIHWYDRISEESDFAKQVIFGEKFISIEDIKNHILSIIKYDYQESIDNNYFMDEDDEYYDDENFGYFDSTGHYNKEGYEAVIEFFENLDDNKIQSILSGSVEDDYEIDINGGRSHLMRKVPLNPMIYNYLVFTKKAKYEELDEELCNSNDVFDDISDYYQEVDIFLPTSKVLNDIYDFIVDKKYQSLIDRYNSMLGNIIENFKNEPVLKEKVEIAKSMKIDMNYIKTYLREEKLNELIS